MLNLQKVFYGISSAVPKLGSILGLTLPTLDVLGAAVFSASPTGPNFIGGVATLVDGATIAVNAALGSTFTITCANNNARAIQVPTNGVAGMRIFVRIINTSGGALTLTTFAAGIKQPALNYPGTGTNREYELFFDGTNWAIMNFSASNVPN